MAAVYCLQKHIAYNASEDGLTDKWSTLCHVCILFSRLLNILEGGLVKHMKTKIYMHTGGCSRDSLAPGHMKISLVEAEGAFYFLGLGVALASIVLLVECGRRCFRSKSKNISPLPNSNRTTSHLPTISSTTGDITTISLSALTDKTYTYTTNFFDNTIWSNGYVDDCEIQYTSNSFMSTFEMLDVATPTGMLRERMASDTPHHRTHWNHDCHRISLPDLSTQVENGYSRTHTRKFGGSLSDGNCTDAETGEFSLNLVGTSEL